MQQKNQSAGLTVCSIKRIVSPIFPDDGVKRGIDRWHVAEPGRCQKHLPGGWTENDSKTIQGTEMEVMTPRLPLHIGPPVVRLKSPDLTTEPSPNETIGRI